MANSHHKSQQWSVGGTTVTAIVEAETPGIPVEFFFPSARAGDVASVEWLQSEAAGSDGTISFRVQSFVLEHSNKLIVIDPCVGNCKKRSLPFWNDLDGPWLHRFLAAGFQPGDVDLVIHTHLHEDHLGWDTHLVDGEWTPTFVNAKHTYVGAELDWIKSRDVQVDESPFKDSIEPVLVAGLGWEVGADTDLGDGLQLFSTPGHTPGHCSVKVQTATEPIIITGDLVHHPFQLAYPKFDEVGDVDVDAAIATRSDFFAEHASTGYLIAGTHFPGNPLGRIANDKNVWRFVPEDPTRNDHSL